MVARIKSPFFKVDVPDSPKVQFSCSRFEDSRLISLVCKWKKGLAKPLLNLFVWDRTGRALAFHYEGYAANLATRTEYQTTIAGVSTALTKERIETSGVFREWNGILHETTGPELTNSQIELVSDSSPLFRAYIQLSMMCGADQLRRIASGVCDSLVVEGVCQWQETSKYVVESLPDSTAARTHPPSGGRPTHPPAPVE